MDHRLREQILSFLPASGTVLASDIVASVGLPARQVWSEIVLMAIDGVITTPARAPIRGGYDDLPALIRRVTL